MASPIRWFRKHSQFFVVVFGVVLMAIFGLGSIMSTLNPSDLARSAQAENPVVAEWSGGELTENDLFALRTKHFAARRFLENVYKYAVEQNNGEAFPVSAEQILPIVRPGENPSNTDLNERIMNRYFFAQRAKQEGFIVDEAMVYRYIALFGGETLLSKQDLKELNKQVNNQVQLAGVVRHLQMELLAQQMENMTRGGIAFDTMNQVSVNAISPTEAIELYARANRKIECRVLPIAVADKIASVGEPSASEMSELYEQGKYDFRTYNFDEPGFKQSKMAKIQYFAGELETFLQNEMAKVTDEEVQAEYERLVAAEDNLVMQLIPSETPDANPDAGDSEEQPASEDPDTEKDPAPEPEKGDDANTDTSDEAADTSDDDPAPAPADGAEADTDAENDQEAEGNSSSGGYTSLGFQEESEQEETAEEQPADDKPAESEDATKESEQSDDDAEEQPAEDDTTNSEADQNDAESTDEPNKPEMQTEGSADDENPDSAETEAATMDDPVIEDDKPKREPKPLADVADQIKRRMKMLDARQARDEVMDQAEKELRKYQMKVNKWEFEKEREDEEDLEQPPLPDFNAIADKLGIQFVETELLDQGQIIDEPIGKVTRLEFNNQQPIQINIGQEIFATFESTALYQPAVADNFADGTKYVYWLSEKVDQKIPEFDEAKESIIKYWKHNKAVEAAMADAQAVADSLNSGNKLLADEKPEKSLDTGAFSWFSLFGRFDYGSPLGVTGAGEEFMSTAFGLDQGKAGVASNEARDTVYVIQMTNAAASDLAEVGTEYLEKNFFLTNQIPREVISAKVHYRREMNFDWSQSFRKHLDIKVVGQ